MLNKAEKQTLAHRAAELNHTSTGQNPGRTVQSRLLPFVDFASLLTFAPRKETFMKLKLQTCLTIGVLAIMLAASASARADAVSDWNLIAIQRIGAASPAHPPPVTFLDMAIVNAAVYDAVQAIERQYQPYHVQIPGASGRSDAAAAKAARDVLVNLFPAQSGTIDGIYNQYLFDKNIPPLDPGIAVGATAAAGIIALRANDGRFRGKLTLRVARHPANGVRQTRLSECRRHRRPFRLWPLPGLQTSLPSL